MRGDARVGGEQRAEGFALDKRRLCRVVDDVMRVLPADANVGPLVDAIRTRVGAALDQSARLDAMVDHERALGRESKKSAN